jgi:drug/metabolite transporter (DMT)-like permease
VRINPITLVGIALIVIGIVAFAYQGITYTSREKIFDIGPFQATADTQKTIPLSPLLGELALVGGIVLVVVGAKKSS